jgi:hypothetical protein
VNDSIGLFAFFDIRPSQPFFCALPRENLFPAQGDSFSCPGSKFRVISDFRFQLGYELHFSDQWIQYTVYSFYFAPLLTDPAFFKTVYRILFPSAPRSARTGKAEAQPFNSRAPAKM